MKSILIVDDEVLLVTALTIKLEASGYQVFSAANGIEALNQLESNLFDLIVLDLFMPVMDGITALQEIKNKDLARGVPIIVLTNLQEDEKISQALSLGVTDYLTKSNTNLDSLVDLIHKKVDNHLS